MPLNTNPIHGHALRFQIPNEVDVGSRLRSRHINVVVVDVEFRVWVGCARGVQGDSGEGGV